MPPTCSLDETPPAQHAPGPSARQGGGAIAVDLLNPDGLAARFDPGGQHLESPSTRNRKRTRQQVQAAARR